MHYNNVWHIKSIYPVKIQVNIVKHTEVIWKSVFSHARVMVIGVSSDLKWLGKTLPLILAPFSSISTIVGPFSPMRTNMAMF